MLNKYIRGFEYTKDKVVKILRILKSFLLTFITLSVFVYMGYVFYDQQIRINKLNSEITSCERRIQEENLESEQLTTTIASMSEDEYMEEVARKRLGYVMPTEIIFMDASI